MTPKIPVSTDNIYKFYATFGLVLVVASILALPIMFNSTTQAILNYQDKLLEVFQEAESAPYKKERLTKYGNLIKDKRDVQQIYIGFLGAMTAVGILLCGYGFSSWHRKIQPQNDEYMELKIEQLKRELRKLPNVPKRSQR